MQRLPQRIFALTSTLEKLGIPHLRPLSSSSSPQSMPKIRSSAIAASTVKQNGPSLTTCALRKCINGTDTENNSSMAFPATCRRCQGVLFGLCNAHVALEVVHTGARCGEVLHVSCCPPFSVALLFPSVHSTESARNRFHRRGGRVPPHDLQSVVTLMCVANGLFRFGAILMVARASEVGMGRSERLPRSAQSTQPPVDATLALGSPKTLYWIFWAFLIVFPKLKRPASKAFNISTNTRCRN
jgi:hypothetical protein